MELVWWLADFTAGRDFRPAPKTLYKVYHSTGIVSIGKMWFVKMEFIVIKFIFVVLLCFLTFLACTRKVTKEYINILY